MTSKLEQYDFEHNNSKYKLLKLQQEVGRLHAREVESVTRGADFTAEVEFLKGEVEHASEEASGKSFQVGFKIFH